jgi:hypothetical protein
VSDADRERLAGLQRELGHIASAGALNRTFADVYAMRRIGLEIVKVPGTALRIYKGGQNSASACQAPLRSAQKLAAKKVLKKVAIAGIVISVAMDASELNAAEEQDELFRSMIADYQTMDSSFELSARLHHAGVTRAALGVAGEEGGTWGGAVGGAALVGALGLPTGPGALAAAAGGAVAGGYGGGVFGRWLGNRVADILEPE